MDTQEVPTTKAVGKNRQWILDARPVGKLTGKEFRHARDHPYREGAAISAMTFGKSSRPGRSAE